jgi:glycosyltransferase involved in cell wall biosynthesis
MAPERLRVLFVSNGLGGGGAERFVSNALQHLDASRFDLRLCLFRRLFGFPIPEGVPVVVLSGAPRFRPWQLPQLVRGVAREIARQSPSVVLSAYSYPSAVVGCALRLTRRRPRWVARLASNPEWQESGLRRVAMRRLYARADLVLANSRGLARAAARIYPALAPRIDYQPNPTDFAQLEALAAEPAPARAAGRSRLVAVGRLRAEKRVDLLIEALARVRRTRDAELVLCGEGPLRGALEAQAARIGVGEAVHFLGFCANPVAWMARADLFASSSDVEGSPNALIEAQGLGVPAVATDCPFGPAEIVEPGRTGWLVPTGDSRALAAAILEALGDPQRLRRMGAEAQRRARADFCAERACARLAAHLERVAA